MTHPDSEQAVNEPMESADVDSAVVEHRYHSYVGNAIPWYVRLIWILFWVFAIYYTVAYLFPDLQTEIVAPP